MRRVALLIAATLIVLTGSPAMAAPKAKAAAKVGKASKRSSQNKGTMKQCSTVRGKKKCKRVAVFQGHGAARSTLRTEHSALVVAWPRISNPYMVGRRNLALVNGDDGTTTCCEPHYGSADIVLTRASRPQAPR